LTIHESIEESILLLTVSPVVGRFQILGRRETETDGYLRIKAILVDQGLLEISIYCQVSGNIVHIVDYRFHWQDKDGRLKMRWDNARHHPELKTFPYHLHVGEEENVKESKEVDLLEILGILKATVTTTNKKDS